MASGETVGLTKGIIDDTCFVLFAFFPSKAQTPLATTRHFQRAFYYESFFTISHNPTKSLMMTKMSILGNDSVIISQNPLQAKNTPLNKQICSNSTTIM